METLGPINFAVYIIIIIEGDLLSGVITQSASFYVWYTALLSIVLYHPLQTICVPVAPHQQRCWDACYQGPVLLSLREWAGKCRAVVQTAEAGETRATADHGHSAREDPRLW